MPQQRDWLLLIPSLLVLLGWIGTIIRDLMHRDRASIDRSDDAVKAEMKVVWGRIDTLRAEVEVCKTDVAVLKNHVSNLPDVSARLDAFEAKLERRFEKFEERFVEALKRGDV